MANKNFNKYVTAKYSVQIVKVLIDTPEFTGTGRKLNKTTSGNNIFVLVETITKKDTGQTFNHKGKDKVATFPKDTISFPKSKPVDNTPLIITDDNLMNEFFISEEKREEKFI